MAVLLPPDKLGRWGPDVIATRPLHRKAPEGTIDSLNVDDIPSLASLREAIRKLMTAINQLEGRNGPITILNDITYLGDAFFEGDIFIDNQTLQQFIENNLSVTLNGAVSLELFRSASVGTTIPLAESIFPQSLLPTELRTNIDLNNFSEFRLQSLIDVTNPGSAGSKLFVKYDAGAGDTRLGATSGDVTVDGSLDNGTGNTVGAWTTIDSGAVGDIELSIWSSGGDGATALGIYSLNMQLR